MEIPAQPDLPARHDRVNDGHTASRPAGQQIAGWSALLLIVVVVVLGGGGASARPGFEAACQLAGFLLLAVLVATGRDERIDRSARPWLALSLAAFALPMAQLLPLPGSLSALLPGRELADAIRDEVGAAGMHPFSLDPDRTILAAISLIPGIGLFAATLRCGEAWRRRLINAWITLGLVAVVMGTVQVASSGTAAQLYDTNHRDAAIGFFANRNHQAMFLLTVLLLFAASLTESRQQDARPARFMRLGLFALLAAGLFITRSRAGLVLFVVAMPVLILLLRRGRIDWRPGWPLLALAGAGLVGLGAFLLYNPVARAVLARFSFVDDPRWTYWPDVLYTLGQVWPAGSGIGTFQAVFSTHERLGTLDDLYLNHAHNDYLELAIEGGLLAGVLIALFLVLLVMRLRTVSHWQGEARRLALAGGIAICSILLHSLVDYPLRSITITALFGFLAGLLFQPAARQTGAEAE
jgi:O-antigen ligase